MGGYRSAMSARRRVSIVTVFVLAIASACGGSGDGDGAPFGPDARSDASSLGGRDVPDGLPSDFYLPADMVPGRFTTSGDGRTSFTGTMETGDVDSVQADMVAGLLDADYELLVNDDIALFVKNGVGQVRVRTSDFLDNVIVSIDIDEYSDEELDELRSLLSDPVVVAATATAEVGGTTHSVTGECRLQGANRIFSSVDGSLTVQIDETLDPPRTYADVATSDGLVFWTEFGADLDYSGSDQELRLSGEMVESSAPDGDSFAFTATATCQE